MNQALVYHGFRVWRCEASVELQIRRRYTHLHRISTNGDTSRAGAPFGDRCLQFDSEMDGFDGLKALQSALEDDMMNVQLANTSSYR